MKKRILILLLSSAICMSGCAGKTETTGTSAFTEASAESTTIATEATASEGTSTESATTSESEAKDSDTTAETTKEKTMVLKIGDTKVPVTWEDNDSVSDLKALAKLVLLSRCLCTVDLNRWAESGKASQEMISRPLLHPETSFYTQETRSSFSTVPIPGPIPALERSIYPKTR